LSPSSSLESASRLENREPVALFDDALEPLFFPPPYERLKLGIRIPELVFFPADESRSVVRIWAREGETEPAGESVLSENLLEG